MPNAPGGRGAVPGRASPIRLGLMPDWLRYLRPLRALAARVPLFGWGAAGVILVSLAVVLFMEMSGPAYVVLDDGLSPADGGKVIAELQKLGIPYQLQAAGNLILVPAPLLAEARLQLGATEDPDGDVGAQWDRLEAAPMTASDLAQSTMAAQALQASLTQSIESLKGIRAAQVYLALPPDTAFLADQPKPTASVVIDADQADAQAQGQAIAELVAGAVPGLAASQVSVATTDGVTVYPSGKGGATSTQFGTIAEVESLATARVSELLAPLVGDGNFRVGVSADLDFTQQQTHQIAYGPAQLIAHQATVQTSQTGNGAGAPLGIPGAMSNEPPAATTAAAAPVPGATATADTGAGKAGAPAAAATPPLPLSTSKNTDQTYVTDQSESNIVHPDWSVKSIAVSVVLNKQALGAVTPAEVKTAIAGAFSYSQVSVNVLAAPFQLARGPVAGRPWQTYGALSGALMEALAAALLLFGFALPVGRRLGGLATAGPVAALPLAQAGVVTLQAQTINGLREQASENIPSVARLLQGWADDGE